MNSAYRDTRPVCSMRTGQLKSHTIRAARFTRPSTIQESHNAGNARSNARHPAGAVHAQAVDEIHVERAQRERQIFHAIHEHRVVKLVHVILVVEQLVKERARRRDFFRNFRAAGCTSGTPARCRRRRSAPKAASANIPSSARTPRAPPPRRLLRHAWPSPVRGISRSGRCRRAIPASQPSRRRWKARRESSAARSSSWAIHGCGARLRDRRASSRRTSCSRGGTCKTPSFPR